MGVDVTVLQAFENDFWAEIITTVGNVHSSISYDYTYIMLAKS